MSINSRFQQVRHGWRPATPQKRPLISVAWWSFTVLKNPRKEHLKHMKTHAIIACPTNISCCKNAKSKVLYYLFSCPDESNASCTSENDRSHEAQRPVTTNIWHFQGHNIYVVVHQHTNKTETPSLSGRSGLNSLSLPDFSKEGLREGLFLLFF